MAQQEAKPEEGKNTFVEVYNNEDYQCGCFVGSSEVLMDDGSTKMVKDIKRGDSIMSLDNTKAKVECLIKFNCFNG